MVVNTFELVQVIENVQQIGQNIYSKIECIECCGKDMYIGTNDGFVILYTLQENQQSSDPAGPRSRRECHRQLESKKPVLCIKAASALNRILVLCDSTILLLDMGDLTMKGVVIVGVNTFCVNENPNINDPFCIQICCAITNKRQLQVYNVSEQQVTHIKDVSILEPAVALALDGSNVCTALCTQYAVYNIVNGSSQRLFSYSNQLFAPVLRRIAKDEFLVSAPEGLGMFVSADGISNRPPIQWSSHLESLAYGHPYILGLGDQVIMVHSILDQQQKQIIPFVGGRTIGNFDGRIYMSSSSSVFALEPVSWELQVEALLADMRVEEALDLTNNTTRIGMSKEKFHQVYKGVEQKAAFIYFSLSDFDKARELFISGGVDICEVISLYPGLLATSSSFIRSAQPLHGISDVEQLFAGDEGGLKQAYTFLRHLLEEVRNTPLVFNKTMEVDTALVKLYSESERAELESLIIGGHVKCDIKDCSDWLKKNNCYHALALLHSHGAGDHDNAFKIWAKIINEELTDDSFPGIQFFIEFLANVNDQDLIWKYADFVLGKDEELAVGIFTCGSYEDIDSIKPETIVEYLHRYPKAVVRYLEHLVLQTKTQIEKFHTHLAVLYLENVLTLKKENADDTLTDETRSKLRNLLKKSNLCRVQLLLGRMLESELFQEAAILYGKLEQHDKALDILVRRLKDFQAADDYCVFAKSSGSKQNVFEMLLATYLNPKLELSEREEYLEPALSLLNARGTDLDAAQVLQLLPPSCSITAVEAFLRSALRNSLHKYRMSKMTSSLARGENLQKKCVLHDLEKHSIPLYSSNYCCICKKPFTELSFARYPNDVLIHSSCMRHSNICPVTGRNFMPIGS